MFQYLSCQRQYFNICSKVEHDRNIIALHKFHLFPHWVLVLVVHFRLPLPAPPTHTQLVHTQLTHTQLVNTQLAHTQLTHTQLAHTQLTHTQLVNTQLAHTHNLLTHNLSTHNLLTHTICQHTTYSHTTCPHTTCSLTTYSHTTCPHTQLTHTQLVNTQLTHTHNLSTHHLLTHNLPKGVALMAEAFKIQSPRANYETAIFEEELTRGWAEDNRLLACVPRCHVSWTYITSACVHYCPRIRSLDISIIDIDLWHFCVHSWSPWFWAITHLSFFLVVWHWHWEIYNGNHQPELDFKPPWKQLYLIH